MPTATITRAPTPTRAAAPEATGEAAGDGHLREPAAIYRRSFALVRDAVAPYPVPDPILPFALRLVHACALPGIVPDLAFAGDPLAAGRAALRGGAPILCDARMVAAGIAGASLPAANPVLVTLGEPGVEDEAAKAEISRSAVAVDRWRPHLQGAVVAIGNAPTALFRLLERLREWPERPALILAFPVGFVGAAESKEALLEANLELPLLTLRGRFGGSALAAAAVNTLLLPEP